MDSLDLIEQFLDENGVRYRRTPIKAGGIDLGIALWLIGRWKHVFVGPTTVAINILGTRVELDLHDPNSLPCLLRFIA